MFRLALCAGLACFSRAFAPARSTAPRSRTVVRAEDDWNAADAFASRLRDVQTASETGEPVGSGGGSSFASMMARAQSSAGAVAPAPATASTGDDEGVGAREALMSGSASAAERIRAMQSASSSDRFADAAAAVAPEGASPSTLAAATAAARRLAMGSGAGDAATDGYFRKLRKQGGDEASEPVQRTLLGGDTGRMARLEALEQGSARAAERIRALQRGDGVSVPDGDGAVGGYFANLAAARKQRDEDGNSPEPPDFDDPSIKLRSREGNAGTDYLKQLKLASRDSKEEWYKSTEGIVDPAERRALLEEASNRAAARIEGYRAGVVPPAFEAQVTPPPDVPAPAHEDDERAPDARREMIRAGSTAAAERMRAAQANKATQETPDNAGLGTPAPVAPAPVAAATAEASLAPLEVPEPSSEDDEAAKEARREMIRAGSAAAAERIRAAQAKSEQEKPAEPKLEPPEPAAAPVSVTAAAAPKPEVPTLTDESRQQLNQLMMMLTSFLMAISGAPGAEPPPPQAVQMIGKALRSTSELLRAETESAVLEQPNAPAHNDVRTEPAAQSNTPTPRPPAPMTHSAKPVTPTPQVVREPVVDRDSSSHGQGEMDTAADDPRMIIKVLESALDTAAFDKLPHTDLVTLSQTLRAALEAADAIAALKFPQPHADAASTALSGSQSAEDAAHAAHDLLARHHAGTLPASDLATLERALLGAREALMAESIPEIGDTGPGAEVEEVAKEALALLSKHHAGTLPRAQLPVLERALSTARRELKKEAAL